MKQTKYFLGILIFCAIFSCKSTNKKTTHLENSKIIVDTLFSKNLNENRVISIYLPKDYNSNKSYPVVYCTDGQIISKNYKSGLDSIMDNGFTEKFIMVGVYSNEKKVENTKYITYRTYEYNKNWGDKKDTVLHNRFKNHLKFFTQEVTSFVKNNYNISQKRKDKVFYGTSNGAGFGVTLGSEKPLLFKNYICFSMAGGVYDDSKNEKKSNYPFYYLAYGTKELVSFKTSIEDFKKYLSQHNYKYKFWTFNGGHDRKMWKKEFFKTIVAIFGKNEL